MSESNITPAAKLKEELFLKTKHASKVMLQDEIDRADSFCEGYMNFLDTAKTEREAVSQAVALARANGFVPYQWGVRYPAGAKVYYNNRGKALILAVIGQKGVGAGIRIAAAHIDSPRLDLKQNPLYEDAEEAFFKTHYYGGIKKYQWTAIPLALHGVIVKKGGETVTVTVGEADDEPKFVITDLLPHLAHDQMSKTMAEGINAENLNVLIGSRPFDTSDEAENVKLNIMNLLFLKYGITEADFQSAELEVVPAFKATDIGFDRSMIGAYGHDDRVCAYPALMAALDCDDPAYTTLCCLTDKEEIGSRGNTGLNSDYLEQFIADLATAEGVTPWSVLSKSQCLSADVNAAYDPIYSEVFEKRNASFINRGVVVTKYTGARGKSDTSDASAEYLALLRDVFDRKGVCYQTGELGKVDIGGGGTVAKFIAALNVETVDVGVPVLSMHAPFEVVSKLDVYAAYRAFYEFFAY